MKELLIKLLEQCFDDGREGRCTSRDPIYENSQEWISDYESEINKICDHE